MEGTGNERGQEGERGIPEWAQCAWEKRRENADCCGLVKPVSIAFQWDTLLTPVQKLAGNCTMHSMQCIVSTKFFLKSYCLPIDLYFETIGGVVFHN